MIVNVIEIFIEYMSVIICLHKAAKKKMVIDQYILLFFVLSVLSVFLAHIYREEYWWLMLITYTNLLIYTKLRLCPKWIQALKVFGIMIITIPSLELVVYFSTKFIFEQLLSKFQYGILINCLVCLIVILWKEKYFFIIAKKIKKSSGIFLVIIFFAFFGYLLYEYKLFEFLYEPFIIQAVIGVIVVGIFSVLWLNTENEKKSKARELQLYKLYNKTFEDAITTIRARQHEFDNHINAIKCLQLTIDDSKELAKAQLEYCDKVLNENSFNKLLKIHTEPILTGFLYSKFMNAKEQGIYIVHEIHAIDFNNRIEINEIIEILGILIDNAVEALRDTQEKGLIVKLLSEDKRTISIEVANRSRKYLNTEIEKFCIHGYSSKGVDRGIGLTRVKEIVKKYKANFYIQNMNYNGDNYLSFKILFVLDNERN